MSVISYPENDRIDVVDQDNVPFAVMEYGDVLAQGLLHRAAAVALQDRAGRLLLRQWPEIGWSFAAMGPVCHGESRAVCAAGLVAEHWGILGCKLRHLGTFPPTGANGNAFTDVYGARAGDLSEVDSEEVLRLPWKELASMMEQAADLFSPFWLQVVRSGCLHGI